MTPFNQLLVPAMLDELARTTRRERPARPEPCVRSCCDPSFVARLSRTLRDLVRSLRRLEELAREGLGCTAELALAVRRRAGDRKTLLARLDRIDGRILDLSSKDIAGFLIQGLIHRITGSGERPATDNDVLAASREMYEGVRESAAFQAELLSRADQRLSQGAFHSTFPARQPRK